MPEYVNVVSVVTVKGCGGGDGLCKKITIVVFIIGEVMITGLDLENIYQYAMISLQKC